MEWAIAWFLVIYQNNFITYSPPFATKKDCELMYDVAKQLNQNLRATCAQVDIARVTNERVK
jgi:hypothetical protein